ncbi:hypothetical protein BLNAU_715 [Blattamonas nauphoetae]|uniref:LisH domain-containing protein n=1 Tax=Blattamonas nauphoetae TaxID=2049346 RepID=A0ABQ9YK98_9EUKA|nr:hypothetical protein BLNAU_715 [Blattamonas nauphoetae]
MSTIMSRIALLQDVIQQKLVDGGVSEPIQDKIAQFSLAITNGDLQTARHFLADKEVVRGTLITLTELEELTHCSRIATLRVDPDKHIRISFLALFPELRDVPQIRAIEGPKIPAVDNPES